MKVIILAAGEGERMRPLSLALPKPLLQYGGKTNLDHLFERLPKEIDEATITICHLGEKIRAHCGSSFHGRTIRYVEGSPAGNVIGFLAARSFIKEGERFAVAYGDEVFAGDELHRAIVPEFSWLCYPAPNPKEVGIATVDEEGHIRAVAEKPAHPASNLAADGFVVLNTDVFSYASPRHARGEYFFSDLMGQFIKTHRVRAVMASAGHTQLTVPVDIERLEKMGYSNLL